MSDTAARREWSAAVVALFPEGEEAQALPLVERAIDKELAATTKEEQLWREESLMVDLVGEFVRAWTAKPLARLAPVIKELLKESKKKEDLTSEAEIRWVVACAEKMLKAVLDAVEESPRILKSAIRQLYSGAKERFPGFQFRAVGALVGLRSYCPAIVSPDTYGLIKPGKEVSPVARKGLVKVAKLLQNVFNETGFEEDAGLPEACQNFIRASIPKFHAVVFSITEGPAQLSDSDSNNLPGSPGEVALHRMTGEATRSLGRKSLFQGKKRRSARANASAVVSPSSDDSEPTLPTSNDPTSPTISPRTPLQNHFVHFASNGRLDGTVGDENELLPHTATRLMAVRSADDLHDRDARTAYAYGPTSSLLGLRRTSLCSVSSEGNEDEEDDLSGCSTGSDNSANGESPGDDNATLLKNLSRSAGAVTVEGSKRTLKSLADNGTAPVRLLSSDSTLVFDPADASGVSKLSCKELVKLLKRYGFSDDTRAALKKAKLRGDMLLKMDNVALHALGIQKLGERKRLLKLAREAIECNGYAFLDRIDIREWSSEEVAKWAAVNGLEEYQQTFLNRGVTGAQLARMADHLQLSEAGVSKWGHRQRMIKLIEEARGYPTPSSKPKGPMSWTSDEVLNWLKSIEMEQYQLIFRTNRITGAELMQLNDAQLVQLGVASLGHRKRLLRNISLLATASANGEDNESS